MAKLSNHAALSNIVIKAMLPLHLAIKAESDTVLRALWAEPVSTGNPKSELAHEQSLKPQTRAEEGAKEKVVKPQPTATKIKGRELSKKDKNMFKRLTQLRAEGHTWIECRTAVKKIDSKMTDKVFDSIIRKYNRWKSRTI